MATPKKTKIVKNLADKLAKSKGVVFTDYRGLTAEQMNALRKELKQSQCEFQVIKNTLLKIGLRQSSYPEIGLTGPTAVVFVNQNIFAALKTLEDYAKTEDLPKIKTGFWEKRVVDQGCLEELAKIPSVEYLKSLVLNSLNSPLNKLVSTLSWNMNQLIYILNQAKAKKGGD